jgi:hypothetical protein
MQELAVRSDFDLVFEAFGVKVRLESDRPELLELGMEIASKALIKRLEIIENANGSVDHTFGIYKNPEGNLYFTNEGQPSGPVEKEIHFRRLLNTMVRVHVAEKAREWVFIHAGVVGWRGKAIILPASSHSGKTTLVSELIRLGAYYYSDEYAVIDPSGMVHPYERDLSVRPPGSEIPIQVPPEEFGAEIGSGPIPVGMVVLTKFENEAEFRPEGLSMGIGIMETVPEVIPIRLNTDFSLKVLNTAFRRAIIIKSLRGEAQIAARSILSYFDDNFDLANND